MKASMKSAPGSAAKTGPRFEIRPLPSSDASGMRGSLPGGGDSGPVRKPSRAGLSVSGAVAAFAVWPDQSLATAVQPERPTAAAAASRAARFRFSGHAGQRDSGPGRCRKTDPIGAFLFPIRNNACFPSSSALSHLALARLHGNRRSSWIGRRPICRAAWAFCPGRGRNRETGGMNLDRDLEGGYQEGRYRRQMRRCGAEFGPKPRTGRRRLRLTAETP